MLHLILGYKSRYDLANNRFSGPARELADDVIPIPYTVSYVGEPIPPEAEALVYCGPQAWRAIGRAERDLGVVTYYGKQKVTCTFHPQDCADLFDVESDLHDADEFDDFGEKDSKDAAPTQRINYRFWFKSHINKLLTERWEHDNFLNIQCPFSALAPATSEYLYLDIETHPFTDTLQCLSIAFDKGPIYSQTIYNCEGELCANAVENVRWLARAMRRHTTVVHNALFDLPFLAMMHGVPWGHKVHDTMAMFHRAFPEADKSLAHVIQYFTNLPYHKDSAGTFNPRNRAQQQQLLQYNAHDVHAMRLVHRGLLKIYTPSMEQVNSSILDYAFAGLHGFVLDMRRRNQHLSELESRVKQLTRILRFLVGDKDFNPNSGQQLATWLYATQPTGLGYRITDRTDAGAPATNATAIYKAIADNEHNVALPVLLEIKELAKKISMLNFEPYTQPDKR